MERINATVPNGTKAKLRAINGARGNIFPSISNEVVQAIRGHLQDNSELFKRGMKMPKGR